MHHYIQASSNYLLDKEVMNEMVDAIRPLFSLPFDEDKAGIYVASSNAGFHSSVQFWSDAKEKGLALASPELFPWTLANGPCSYLAREFHIKGPNVTLVGNGSAVNDCIQMCCDHMESGMITLGWVVALDFGTSIHPSFLVAICFDETGTIKEFCNEIFNNQISTEQQPSMYLQSILNGFGEEIEMKDYAASL